MDADAELLLDGLNTLVRRHVGRGRLQAPDMVDDLVGKLVALLGATRFGNQRTINDPICEALKDVASKETLLNWEDAIGRSGTFVARRVWSIFFSPKNRLRWAHYLRKKYAVTQAQAKLILDRIYYLPASKRKPFDT